MTLYEKQTATVQPGGIITLCLTALPVGATVDVTVRLETETNPTPRSLVRFIGAAKGNFAAPQEVDRFIRQERESWEF
ncbi:MAG: hypothetical protein SW833_28500 [Cyanobacteriota bacterium]|nr:hypothetical protein [Cyanobacteriota bacterium]